MRKLISNSRLVNPFLLTGLVWILVGCSGKSQTKENLLEDGTAPDVIFGNDSMVLKNLSFEDFLDNTQTLYQARKFSSLSEYIEQYAARFSKEEEQKEIDIIKATAMIGNKKLKEAVTLLKRHTEDQDPAIKGKSLFYMAEISRLKKNYKEALKYYGSAYQILKKQEILSSIADTYVAMSDYKKAESYYQQILAHNPNSVQDRLYLGLILFKREQFKDSQRHFEYVLQLDPSSQKAYHYLYLLAQKQNRMGQAYYFLSREYLLARQYNKVIELLNNKNEIYEDIRLFKIAISSYIRIGNPDQSINILQTGLIKNTSYKNDVDVKVYEGILIINKKQGIAKAMEYFKTLYAQYPNNFNVIVSYADISEKQDNSVKGMRKVIDLYKKALIIEPQNREYRYKLANYYETNNQVKEAQINFGILFFYQEQYDRAMEAFLFLEKDNVMTKDIALYMAMVYEKLGGKKESQTYYKKALKLGAGNLAKEGLERIEQQMKKG